MNAIAAISSTKELAKSAAIHILLTQKFIVLLDTAQ